jgi:hypothetical protein
MKTPIKYKVIVIASLIISLSLSVYSQSFPIGGYQGGTHGNIKYILWTGTVDNDWAEPGNWCPVVIRVQS